MNLATITLSSFLFESEFLFTKSIYKANGCCNRLYLFIVEWVLTRTTITLICLFVYCLSFSFYLYCVCDINFAVVVFCLFF